MVTFTATVNFDNATPAMIPLENQATTSGTFDPDPLTPGDEIDVNDISDNGTNPNSDNGSGLTDDPTPLIVSDIELTKSVTGIAPATSGTTGNFDVTYVLTVKNTASQPLTNLSLVDDFKLNLAELLSGLLPRRWCPTSTQRRHPTQTAATTGPAAATCWTPSAVWSKLLKASR